MVKLNVYREKIKIPKCLTLKMKVKDIGGVAGA